MPGDQDDTRDELGRWRPGVSGNPAGKPPGSGILPAIRAGLTPERAKAIADRAIALAEDGDPKLLALILDRIDGPVTQKVEHSGALTLGDALAMVDATPPQSDEVAGE